MVDDGVVVVSTMACAPGCKELKRPERFPDLESAHAFIRRRAGEERSDGRRGVKGVDDFLAESGMLTVYFKRGFILFRVDVI